MFFTVLFVVGIFGHLSNGVPLEGPSVDYKLFFESRIVGGTDAPKGAAPYMVALIVGYTWQSFVCGASIISKDWVLTAAHCITGFIQWNGDLLDTFHGMAGTNIWHKGTVIEFKDYHLHPEYDAWLIKNDVGVLQTRHQIQMSDRIAPIGINFGQVPGGVKCYVTGWGTDRLWGMIPDRLQYLNLTTLSHKECVTKMDKIVGQSGGLSLPIDSKVELCTFHSPGHGMCHGDSGSALVCEGSYLVSAITSWGFPCAMGAPDVFASMFGSKEWLSGVLRLYCSDCNVMM